MLTSPQALIPRGISNGRFRRDLPCLSFNIYPPDRWTWLQQNGPRTIWTSCSMTLCKTRAWEREKVITVAIGTGNTDASVVKSYQFIVPEGKVSLESSCRKGKAGFGRDSP